VKAGSKVYLRVEKKAVSTVDLLADSKVCSMVLKKAVWMAEMKAGL